MFNFIPNRLSLIVLISACSIILISMGLRQTFGLFFSAFEEGLGCTRTEFGLAIGIQMLFWGMFAPLFGVIADKLGGNKAVFIGFIIFGLGIYMLYAGPNTGIFFQISLGVLVGIALGATAIGVPVSEVGKHFTDKNRTLATGIVTAAASIGYFLAPLFTKYSLGEVGWQETFKYFMYFVFFGAIASLFILPVKKLLESVSTKGIYDHLGGGISRYTVDEKWIVPHFEKMLYDNCLLYTSPSPRDS